MAAQRSITSIESAVTVSALRALVTIADSGSFHRAAAQLGYSQSAVSHQIAALERALGAQLFRRPGGRGAVALTPAGEAAYRQGRRALGAVEAVAADVRDADRGERGRIRVGVSQTTAAELMPAALRDFRADRPGVEVVLDEAGETRDLVAALARGDLDLAFALSPEPDDRITTVPLLDDPLVILTRRDGSLAGLESPTFDVLDGAELVAWNRHWQIQLDLEEALRRRGIAPKILSRTDDTLALQRLVAAGLGHACVGTLSARRAVDPALTYLAPPQRLVPREITLCLPRQRALSGSVRALAEAVEAHARRAW